MLRMFSFGMKPNRWIGKSTQEYVVCGHVRQWHRKCPTRSLHVPTQQLSSECAGTGIQPHYGTAKDPPLQQRGGHPNSRGSNPVLFASIPLAVALMEMFYTSLVIQP